MLRRLVKKVWSYDFNDFTSDIGGLLGLFLGLSFWSMYTFAMDGLVFAYGKVRKNK